jgi:hypothetical protein
MHQDYIQEITSLLERCKDIPTLELVFQILVQKVQHTQ